MKFPSGRIVGVFGLPCSGKTTVIKTLIAASRNLIAHISSGDIARKLSSNKEIEIMKEGNLFPFEDVLRDELIKVINLRKSRGADLIILDGFPRFSDQVQWMLDNGLAGTLSDGCLIQIMGDDLINRAMLRLRDVQDGPAFIKKKIEKQRQMINSMEDIIHRMGIPYYVVINHDVVNATHSLAKILKLRK
jgi:adenylate kinase family enzyme